MAPTLAPPALLNPNPRCYAYMNPCWPRPWPKPWPSPATWNLTKPHPNASTRVHGQVSGGVELMLASSRAVGNRAREGGALHVSLGARQQPLLVFLANMTLEKWV
jgi:hypothetical protein